MFLLRGEGKRKTSGIFTPNHGETDKRRGKQTAGDKPQESPEKVQGGRIGIKGPGDKFQMAFTYSLSLGGKGSATQKRHGPEKKNEKTRDKGKLKKDGGPTTRNKQKRRKHAFPTANLELILTEVASGESRKTTRPNCAREKLIG